MSKTNKQQTIRNIIIFTILVNGLAWLGPLLGGSPTEPGLGFLVWGTAPLVAALIMKLALRDKRALGLKLNLKGNGRFYLLSILFYPVTIGIVLAAGWLLGAITLNTMPAVDFIMALIPLTVTYLIFALFEEFGWRGYLSPKVYSVNDGLLGHAVVGVVWASWHFPYIRELWFHTSEGLATLLPRFLLGTIIFAIVYGEIWLRTQSVWPAALMHWLGNTFANSLLTTIVVLAPGRAWVGSLGVEGVLMIALCGLVGGFLFVRRRNAIVYEKYGSPKVLQQKGVEKPAPKKDEVLIEVTET